MPGKRRWLPHSMHVCMPSTYLRLQSYAGTAAASRMPTRAGQAHLLHLLAGGSSVAHGQKVDGVETNTASCGMLRTCCQHTGWRLQQAAGRAVGRAVGGCMSLCCASGAHLVVRQTAIASAD
jgi:hypothetical protein